MLMLHFVCCLGESNISLHEAIVTRVNTIYRATIKNLTHINDNLATAQGVIEASLYLMHFTTVILLFIASVSEEVRHTHVSLYGLYWEAFFSGVGGKYTCHWQITLTSLYMIHLRLCHMSNSLLVKWKNCNY